ncbi:hypothetical protein U9M48_036656, partial [Paspalum notatum var. saurae]
RRISAAPASVIAQCNRLRPFADVHGIQLWHRRLGHLGHAALSRLASSSSSHVIKTLPEDASPCMSTLSSCSFTFSSFSSRRGYVLLTLCIVICGHLQDSQGSGRPIKSMQCDFVTVNLTTHPRECFFLAHVGPSPLVLSLHLMIQNGNERVLRTLNNIIRSLLFINIFSPPIGLRFFTPPLISSTATPPPP